MEDTTNTENNKNNQPEREPKQTGPQIYVASLTDYNSGRLHGSWVDATTGADQIHTDINEMLNQSPEPDAEEWAIHDHQGFGPWTPGEHESIDTIARIAEGIEEHGDAYPALAAELGTDELERFDDIYLGHWPSMTAYADEILDDLIDLDRHIPDWIAPYVRVDTDAYARDLATELHTVTATDGGIHIFQP